MKQRYDHSFLYILLVYIVNLTNNYEYILLYFIVERKKISRVYNTTFLTHQFQYLDNLTFKKILINIIYFKSGHTAI